MHDNSSNQDKNLLSHDYSMNVTYEDIGRKILK